MLPCGIQHSGSRGAPSHREKLVPRRLSQSWSCGEQQGPNPQRKASRPRLNWVNLSLAPPLPHPHAGTPHPHHHTRLISHHDSTPTLYVHMVLLRPGQAAFSPFFGFTSCSPLHFPLCPYSAYPLVSSPSLSFPRRSSLRLPSGSRPCSAPPLVLDSASAPPSGS